MGCSKKKSTNDSTIIESKVTNCKSIYLSDSGFEFGDKMFASKSNALIIRQKRLENILLAEVMFNGKFIIVAI